MSTHLGQDRTSFDVDAICDLVETHGSAFALALLWLVPVVALVIAVLHA